MLVKKWAAVHPSQLQMTYSESIQFLYELRQFGTKLGLENSRKLAALAGNPQERLRFIHVAGTNGKGSTCAMLESIYRASGMRVGLYTSPHLVSFRERMQVNRELASEADIARLATEARGWLEEFESGAVPTFFEVVTVMALRYFEERKCELVIWETGMGGRLDATNIVVPLASVITNVDFDHQLWLGSTLEAIATEKAGIIKPGVPVITSEKKPDVLRVFQRVADGNGSELIKVGTDDAERAQLLEMPMPLMGEHQLVNAALAMKTAEVLSGTISIDSHILRDGLSKVQWPGRLQVHSAGPGRTILLDGAHNPAGADALRAALQRHFPGAMPTLVLGILGDKDWAAMCQALAPLAGRIGLAPVQSSRAVDPVVAARYCQEVNPYVEITVAGSAQEALKRVADDPLVVITGSLYFVGEALEVLGLSPVSERDEKALNEWTAAP